MNILVACEESQRVTEEFRKLGHKAFSCDIIKCSGGHPDGTKKRQPKWYYDTLKLSPTERAKARSRTFQGIAHAIAIQYGK